MFVAALLGLTLSSCLVTHRRFPTENVGSAAPSKSYGKMYYAIEGASRAGGRAALEAAFKSAAPFTDIERAEQPPPQGIFVKATIKTISPSTQAAAFRRLSYATLTALPSWSRRGGYEILCEVWVDEKKMTDFSYPIRRKEMIWLPLLPFSWINFLTYSEEQAFEATALRFFDEADSLFRTVSTSTP